MSVIVQDYFMNFRDGSSYKKKCKMSPMHVCRFFQSNNGIMTDTTYFITI